MTPIQEAVYREVAEWVEFAIKIDSVAVSPAQYLSTVEYNLRATYTSSEIRQAVRELIAGGDLLQGELLHMSDRMGRKLFYQDGRAAMDCRIELPESALEAFRAKDKAKRARKEAKSA